MCVLLSTSNVLYSPLLLQNKSLGSGWWISRNKQISHPHLILCHYSAERCAGQVHLHRAPRLLRRSPGEWIDKILKFLIQNNISKNIFFTWGWELQHRVLQPVQARPPPDLGGGQLERGAAGLDGPRRQDPPHQGQYIFAHCSAANILAVFMCYNVRQIGKMGTTFTNMSL